MRTSLSAACLCRAQESLLNGLSGHVATVEARDRSPQRRSMVACGARWADTQTRRTTEITARETSIQEQGHAMSVEPLNSSLSHPQAQHLSYRAMAQASASIPCPDHAS
jgi:hypothetical protein